MTGPLWQIGLNLLLAWAAGAAIGFERSYNGRAAGLRTHALVGLASASVLVISYLPLVSPGFPLPAERIDPTRLAQGVMTGIGFLGAGVIFKEGVSVQGLTTAASIWASAAIGLLFGLGMYSPGVLTLIGVLITLTVMRWAEQAFPWRIYAMAVLRFQVGRAPSETELKAMLAAHGAEIFDISYRLSDGGEVFEYRGAVETRRDQALHDLAAQLRGEPGLIEYELARISK
jgi:putative Mg2+ transporter-C (MgtC) family protein